METIINATPHEIVVYMPDGSKRVIPPSGTIIRVSVTTDPCEPVDGVPTVRSVYGDPIGLPEYKYGKYYIVSALVKAAVPYRQDLLIPADLVRDSEGKIIGCKSLSY